MKEPWLSIVCALWAVAFLALWVAWMWYISDPDPYDLDGRRR